MEIKALASTLLDISLFIKLKYMKGRKSNRELYSKNSSLQQTYTYTKLKSNPKCFKNIFAI